MSRYIPYWYFLTFDYSMEKHVECFGVDAVEILQLSIETDGNSKLDNY
jgi:hypothetical protein